jgi:hypothetical protein
MDFLKKNYEKIVLVVVGLGLAVAVALLPFQIKSEQEKTEEMQKRLANPKVKALTNLDLSVAEHTLQRVSQPLALNFAEPNKLFNSMPWQKAPDGHLVLASKLGPSAATVTNIMPLYLKLTLDSVTVLDTGVKYVIGIENQAALAPDKRRKKGAFCTLNPPTKNEVFSMLDVKGKAEEPTQILVRLNDTGETAVITKDQPFKRIEGYTADVRYDPEKLSRPNCRVGTVLRFNGEEYRIVTINQNEVVLSATSNQKKWTIKFNPTP